MKTPEQSKSQLTDDEFLLKEIIQKAHLADSIYAPGPYWYGKSQNAIDELKIHGLSGFRGFNNGAGTSFSDNPRVDVRNDLAFRKAGKLVKRILKTAQPLKNIFDSSSMIARTYFEQSLEYKNFVRSKNEHVEAILQQFSSIDTLVGSPVDVYSSQDGTRFSNHYLDIIHTQLSFSNDEYLKRARTFMEIGGGFGANVHVLTHRFVNIRKIVYLDISPNLYVAIQYLKHHLGTGNVFFKSGSDLSNFKFADDDSLEILCILPQDIESLGVEIDVFWNAHSFVEMTEEIVANYAKHILRLGNAQNSAIYITSYDRFSLDSTIDPLRLGDLFEREFAVSKVATLEPNRVNYHFLGKLS